MSNDGPARSRWFLAVLALVAVGSVANVYVYGAIGGTACIAYLIGRAAQRDVDRRRP